MQQMARITSAEAAKYAVIGFFDVSRAAVADGIVVSTITPDSMATEVSGNALCGDFEREDPASRFAKLASFAIRLRAEGTN